MKILILAVLMSVFYISVKAQCRDIQKSSNEFTQTVTYNSPQLNSDLVSYRVFVKGVKTTCIVAQCLSYALDYQVQGVYFKLDNGNILKNENAKSIVRYDGNNKYCYYIQFDLNDTDLV